MAETHIPASGQNLDETHIPSQNEGGDMGATVIGEETKPAKPAKQAAAPAAKAKETEADHDKSGAKKVSQLGDFLIIKKLGQGGMGTVYLAKQVSLDRQVALKTLSKEFAKKPDFVQRFIRECRAMAKLQHQNAVQVYAADSNQGIHYVAIEFIDGQSMQDWMDQLGKLSVGDALNVILTSADALRHAHELNMIHRDIKPDNILVTKKGVVKVADFGLAKAMDEDVSMTQSGTGLGTPLYMAPEQARNAKHVDQRTDIYALGTTLYYFLTGKLPYSGSNTLELIMAKETGKFTPARRLNPDVPERLDLMIDKMIAKDPAHRYSTCAELMHDLENLHLDNPSLSFIDGGAGTAARTARRAPTSVATSSARTAEIPRSSAEDAARKEAEAAAKKPAEQWYVQHTNAQGKTVVTRMTTPQIQQAIKSGMLDLKAKAKRTANDQSLPLAQFSEFESLMQQRAVKAQADARSTNMKEMYDKLDRQDRRQKRWRWLKNLTGGAFGYVGLLIYLALVCAALYGGYLGIKWAYPFIAAKLGLGGGA
jgi:serine/threonine-protein kinase